MRTYTCALLGFPVRGMNPTSGTKLLKFETLWIIFLVFRGGVVTTLTCCASQCNHNAILFAFACHFFLHFRFWLAMPLYSNYNKSP